VTKHYNITFKLHFNDTQMQTVDKTVSSGQCWSASNRYGLVITDNYICRVHAQSIMEKMCYSPCTATPCWWYSYRLAGLASMQRALAGCVVGCSKTDGSLTGAWWDRSWGGHSANLILLLFNE